jgi:hypothetical protein
MLLLFRVEVEIIDEQIESTEDKKVEQGDTTARHLLMHMHINTHRCRLIRPCVELVARWTKNRERRRRDVACVPSFLPPRAGLS